MKTMYTRPILSENIHYFFIKNFPSLYQKVKFLYRRKYWPNLEHPSTICEILVKMKLDRRSAKLSIFTDKLGVREYISKEIDKHNLSLHLTKIIAVENNFSNLNLHNAKSTCFIKTNHGSGTVALFDPSSSDLKVLKEFFDYWMQRNYALVTGELTYIDIEPRIFTEEVLTDSSGNIPDDIKVHCYYGAPVIIQILRRRNGIVERATFNSEWEIIQVYENETLKLSTSDFPKQEIIDICEILSTMSEYVRVDLYYNNGLIYFGELTFFPESGMPFLKNRDVDKSLGTIFKRISEQGSENSSHVFPTCEITAS